MVFKQNALSSDGIHEFGSDAACMYPYLLRRCAYWCKICSTLRLPAILEDSRSSHQPIPRQVRTSSAKSPEFGCTSPVFQKSYFAVFVQQSFLFCWVAGSDRSRNFSKVMTWLLPKFVSVLSSFRTNGNSLTKLLEGIRSQCWASRNVFRLVIQKWSERSNQETERTENSKLQKSARA